jgi:hypothetical protein
LSSSSLLDLKKKKRKEKKETISPFFFVRAPWKSRELIQDLLSQEEGRSVKVILPPYVKKSAPMYVPGSRLGWR